MTYSGRVRYYNSARGFGFISPSCSIGGVDPKRGVFFCHKFTSGGKYLKNDQVEFSLQSGSHDLFEAVDVSGGSYPEKTWDRLFRN